MKRKSFLFNAFVMAQVVDHWFNDPKNLSSNPGEDELLNAEISSQ